MKTLLCVVFWKLSNYAMYISVRKKSNPLAESANLKTCIEIIFTRVSHSACNLSTSTDWGQRHMPLVARVSCVYNVVLYECCV